MRFFRSFILLLLIHQAVIAQFNDSINYFAHYASTGVINKTNDGKAYVLNNNMRFSVRKKRVEGNTSGSWTFGKQGAVLTNDDYTASINFNLYKTWRHFYYWGLGNFEKSYSLKINHRLQAGVGVGYDVIDRKNTVVVLSDGILYEKSDLYDSEVNGPSEYETFRNSFRVKFRCDIKGVFVIDGMDFIQHSLSDRSDYILKSATNLSLKLMKWLSLTTSVNYNKVNKTARDTLFINYGLVLEKYF